MKTLARGIFTLSTVLATVTLGQAQVDDFPPEIIAIGTAQTINCTSNPVAIGVTINHWAPGFSYQWNTGETDSILYVKPASTTEYELVISNVARNIHAVRAFRITVKNDPVVATSNPVHIDKYTCPGEEVVVSVTATGGYAPFTYRWSNGADKSAFIAPALTNTAFDVTVTDVCGQTAESTVDVTLEPHDPIEAPELTAFSFTCENEEVKIYPKLSGIKGGVGFGYIYSFSDWSEPNKSTTVQATDGMEVEAFVTDACRNQRVSTIIRLDQIAPEIPTPADLQVCKGDVVDVTADAKHQYFYWNESTLNASFETPVVSSSSFSLEFMDECGAMHTVERVVTVDQPTASFVYDVHAYENRLELNVTEGSTDYEYRWLLNGDPIAEGMHHEVALDKGQTVEVALEVTTERGCIGTSSQQIVMLDNLSIPNAFSPNNDGQNDVFRMEHDEEFATFSVKIFDRWGQLVFESNDQYFEWGGDPAMDSQLNTYAYILKGVTVSGQKVDRTGTLTTLN